MTLTAFRKGPNLSLLAAALFCLAAPLWGFHVLYRHNAFLSEDSFQLLGATLLLAVLAPQNWGGLILSAADRAGSFWERNRLAGLTLVLGAAFVLLVAVNRLVLHRFLNSADEHSCYFLAECFRLGHWKVKPPELSEFFNVVHVGNRDGKWFSVYPPGWPLLYAAALQLRIPDLMNPLLTLPALFFFYKTAEKLHGARTAALALVLTAFTAFFIYTGASYYSHTTCLLCMTLFSYAFLHWRESRGFPRLCWAGVAAVAVGYGLITRYLTMAAFAAPFLLYHFVPLVLPVYRKERKLQADEIAVLSILAFFMAVVFWQNLAVTGNLFKAPNRYDKSWERLGFNSDYTPVDGVVFIIARLFYLMDWVPPAFPFLFAAVLLRRPQKPFLEKLFHYAFFYPSFVYFLYFSWGGNQYGPRYWYEGFPFLILTLVQGSREWIQSGSVQARKMIALLLLAGFASGGYSFWKQGVLFEQISRQRRSLYDLAETTLREPSIVYIHGFLGDALVLGEEDAVRNPPHMNAKILYAHDRGDDNTRLRNLYPDRRHYRGTYDRKKGSAVLEELPPGESTP